MVFRSGTGSEPEAIQSHRAVFTPNQTEQKWFNIKAKRVGSHAVLIVSDLKSDSGTSDVVEKTSLKNVGFSRLRRETAQLITGSLPANQKPEMVNQSESNIELSSLKLNGHPIYLWEFSAKSENFDKSGEEIDVDVDPEAPEVQSTCPACWQFSGEDSWVYINEESHSKYMLNKESGTIMFQLKLKAPIYSDGLIFFIGDPEQSDFFIAFELVNGRPLFSYNLGYENGPTTVSLHPKQTKYIPTQYENELNFRIGMVGGVAGLAVQEWRANRVVSVENDYYLKTKSKVCEGCNFKLKNELHFGGIKALGRDLSHLSKVLASWDRPYRGCMGRPKINHQYLSLAQTALKRSNVMEGCNPDRINRVSVKNGQMLQRHKLTASLADFYATFAISIMAGFTDRPATIFRVRAAQGPDVIEIKMENNRKFTFHSDFDGEKTIKLPEQNVISADEETQILLERKNGEQIRVKIGEFEQTFDAKRVKNSAPQDVEISIGGHLRRNEVKEYFNGCVISPYVKNLKDAETGRRLFSVFENFQCRNSPKNCFGEVSFNQCLKNVPQSLMLGRPVRNEVLTVLADRDGKAGSRGRGGKGRGRGRRKCLKIDDAKLTAPLKVEKYKMDKNSMIKMNQKNLAEFFKTALRIKMAFEYEEVGSLLQLVDENCAVSISVLLIGSHVRLVLKMDGQHLAFTSDSQLLRSGKNELELAIIPKDGKTEFTLTLNGNSKTKKVKKNLTQTFIKSIYIGKSPSHLQCSDLHHTHSFKGHFYSATINGAPLKTRRFENAPAVLAGPRIPGIFLGKKSSLQFAPENPVEKISLTLRTRQDSGEVFSVENLARGEIT